MSPVVQTLRRLWTSTLSGLRGGADVDAMPLRWQDAALSALCGGGAVLLVFALVGGSCQEKPAKAQAVAPIATIVPGGPEDTFAAERACKALAVKALSTSTAPPAKRTAANEVMSLPFRGGPDWPLLPEFKARLEAACATLGAPLVPPSRLTARTGGPLPAEGETPTPTETPTRTPTSTWTPIFQYPTPRNTPTRTPTSPPGQPTRTPAPTRTPTPNLYATVPAIEARVGLIERQIQTPTYPTRTPGPPVYDIVPPEIGPETDARFTRIEVALGISTPTMTPTPTPTPTATVTP